MNPPDLPLQQPPHHVPVPLQDTDILSPPSTINPMIDYQVHRMSDAFDNFLLPKTASHPPTASMILYVFDQSSHTHL